MKTVLIDETEKEATTEPIKVEAETITETVTEKKVSNKEIIIAVVIIVLTIGAFLIYNYIQKKNDNGGNE